MTRLLGALLVGLALVFAVPAGARAASSSSRPNVVLIVTDDQRWDTLWAMPTVQSRLVERGTTMQDAFVVNALCAPSRASILTGSYSHSTGLYRQAPPFGRFEWFRDGSTLATWLHDAGYRTGMFGKYLDGYQHAALTGYVPPGWDRWVAFVHSGYVDYALTVDDRIERFGSRPEDYSTDVLTDRAIDFILGAGDRPLFLEFAPAAPHAPAIPAPGDEGAFEDLPPWRPPSFDQADVRSEPSWVRSLPRLDPVAEARVDAFRRGQYASLLEVDRSVGRILDALRETGRLGHTLIVFTSDNAIAWGEHRWPKKEVPWDEAIHVPMVWRWDDGGVGAGARRAELALNIDIAPTIAEAAGIPARQADGRSLLPLLRGEPAAWRRDFLTEHLAGTNPIPTYCAVRSRTWTYVRTTDGQEQLYDLTSDPYELANLAADPTWAEALTRMRARLGALCNPPPPGFGDDGFDARIALALGGLVGLLGAVAARDRRAVTNRGP